MGPHVQPPAHCPCLPLTVSIRWIVVEDGASGPVVTTQHDEVALVIGGAAEAAVASGGETAVLGRARAEVTVQYPRVHQYDGHVALCQVRLDVLHTHRAVGGRRVSRCFWAPLPISLVELWLDLVLPCVTQLGDTAHLPSTLSSLQVGTSCFVTVAQTQPRAKHRASGGSF